MKSRAILPFVLVPWLLTVSACATTEEPPAPAPKQADGTLVLEATSIAVAAGYMWGEGTLNVGGKSYPVTLSGFTVLAVGVTSVRAHGSVYNLKSLDDFDGKYYATRGGSTIGEGGAGVAMVNAKGVEVRLVADNTGVTLTLGAGGVSLELEKPSP